MTGSWEEAVYPFAEAKTLAKPFFREAVPREQLEPFTDQLPDPVTYSYIMVPFLLEDTRDSLGLSLRLDLPKDVLALYGALVWLESGRLQPSDTGGIDLIQGGAALIEETIAPWREFRERNLSEVQSYQEPEDMQGQLDYIREEEQRRQYDREHGQPEGTRRRQLQEGAIVNLDSNERQIAFWERLEIQVQVITTTLDNEIEALQNPPLPDH